MINTCHIGDCRDTLRGLAALGVRAQMCVTSPPYFGLRDYGHAGQIGLESTPDAYVAQMVEVFRCVRDVLTDDGTLWLNLGDSYAASQSNNGGYSAKSTLAGFTKPDTKGRIANDATKARAISAGVAPKNLLGIPWRVAFALQADGWYLRSDIIWHKPNPMPESVTDRPTKAHEYLFLLAKSERYYYDAAAIVEESVTNDPRRPYGSAGANALDVRDSPQGGGKPRAPANRKRGEFAGKTGDNAFRAFTETRNKRTVWTIAPRPYKGAHFAVFPPALVEPCILAGSRPGDVVLDPFMGSGTTAQVAQQHGRQWIGCELNPDYLPLQAQRMTAT